MIVIEAKRPTNRPSKTPRFRLGSCLLELVVAAHKNIFPRFGKCFVVSALSICKIRLKKKHVESDVVLLQDSVDPRTTQHPSSPHKQKSAHVHCSP